MTSTTSLANCCSNCRLTKATWGSSVSSATGGGATFEVSAFAIPAGEAASGRGGGSSHSYKGRRTTFRQGRTRIGIRPSSGFASLSFSSHATTGRRATVCRLAATSCLASARTGGGGIIGPYYLTTTGGSRPRPGSSSLKVLRSRTGPASSRGLGTASGKTAVLLTEKKDKKSMSRGKYFYEDWEILVLIYLSALHK